MFQNNYINNILFQKHKKNNGGKSKGILSIMYKKVFMVLLKLVKMKNINCCRIGIASAYFCVILKNKDKNTRQNK